MAFNPKQKKSLSHTTQQIFKRRNLFTPEEKMQIINNIQNQVKAKIRGIPREKLNEIGMSQNDLLQEISLKLLTALDYCNSKEKATSFAIKVSDRRIISFLRQKQRMTYGLGDSVDYTSDPKQKSVESDQKSEKDALAQAIKTLSRNNQTILELYIQGKRFKEIAEIQNRSTATIRKQLTKIRRRLGKKLKKRRN